MRDRLLRGILSVPLLDTGLIAILNYYSRFKASGLDEKIPNDVLEANLQSETKWIIQTSVPRSNNYKNWGDYYFAQEIIESLKKHGKKGYLAFRNDIFNSNEGDVYIVLRGLYPSKPIKNLINIIWVISHPNQVGSRELNKFNFVFAASEKWSKIRSKKLGKNIFYLSQATNIDKFKYPNESKRSGIVFVGNSVKRSRKIVSDVLELGFRIKIIGQGWAGKVPSELVFATSLDNAELPKMYGSACVVLNDHWRDMRVNGFVSNRIYDAIACGATVISDDVRSDLSIPNFYKYKNRTHLNELITTALNKCSSSLDKKDPELEEFIKNNSFDERIKQIVDLTIQFS